MYWRCGNNKLNFSQIAFCSYKMIFSNRSQPAYSLCISQKPPVLLETVGKRFKGSFSCALFVSFFSSLFFLTGNKIFITRGLCFYIDQIENQIKAFLGQFHKKSLYNVTIMTLLMYNFNFLFWFLGMFFTYHLI